MLDLTEMLAAAGIRRDDYIPAYWDLGQYRGRMWALPTTPNTTALHWNKRLFSEAGLNPESPPETIEELDALAEKLTKWEVTGADGQIEICRGYCPEIPDGDKRLIQVGFLPSEPGWWIFAWGNYFGGTLFDESGAVTALSSENIRGYEWVASYSRKLGVQNIQRFRSGFGNFASPQNAFLSGKVAMEIQGVWMYNYIDKYAPGMQWGAAPFPHPAETPQYRRTATVDADLIIIPKDSSHPQEAFAFIRFLNSQEGMEMLCLEQNKFTPLKQVSAQFKAAQIHPYIEVFRDLAFSPNGFSIGKTGIWNEYIREMGTAISRILNLSMAPEQALQIVQDRIAVAATRNRRMLANREGIH